MRTARGMRMENCLVSLITSKFIQVSSWTSICSMTIFAELHISVSPVKILIHDGSFLSMKQMTCVGTTFGHLALCMTPSHASLMNTFAGPSFFECDLLSCALSLSFCMALFEPVLKMSSKMLVLTWRRDLQLQTQRWR